MVPSSMTSDTRLAVAVAVLCECVVLCCSCPMTVQLWREHDECDLWEHGAVSRADCCCCVSFGALFCFVFCFVVLAGTTTRTATD